MPDQYYPQLLKAHKQTKGEKLNCHRRRGPEDWKGSLSGGRWETELNKNKETGPALDALAEEPGLARNTNMVAHNLPLLQFQGIQCLS